MAYTKSTISIIFDLLDGIRVGVDWATVQVALCVWSQTEIYWTIRLTFAIKIIRHDTKDQIY